MKRLLSICLLLLASACGPKEIGYTYADEPMTGGVQSTAEVMRYPLTGASNTQKILYQTNRPAVMEQMTNWNLAQYRRQLGLDANPENQQIEPAPKQRSPFRQ